MSLTVCTTPAQAADAVASWVASHVPASWQQAARDGGPAAVRSVRAVAEYHAWYPTFARSGLVVPTWPAELGGLGWDAERAAAAEEVLRPYHLPRLNPLGLGLAAPALFTFGSAEQRVRFLPPIARNELVVCQLFSEPGAGSDLASLATRATPVGEQWVIDGRKIWTTWADRADLGLLLARTDPDMPKRAGLTYFLLDMHQPGVQVLPLRDMSGRVDFFEVVLAGALVADVDRLGDVGAGWKVAGATLQGERQMVSGIGSGGVDRVGGGSATHLVRLARARASAGLPGGWDDPVVRERLVRLWSEEQIRRWTNERVAAALRAGRPPGPESSINKVHASQLNQRVQSTAAELLGMGGVAWALDQPAGAYSDGMPDEVRGMLRSRANTIEGGTTEVNRTIIAERVLGLPREPDPWAGRPWREIPKG